MTQKEKPHFKSRTTPRWAGAHPAWSCATVRCQQPSQCPQQQPDVSKAFWNYFEFLQKVNV